MKAISSKFKRTPRYIEDIKGSCVQCRSSIEKMSVTVVGILVLCAVAGCQANTYRMGACPRVTVLEQMDFDKFLGEWFVIQRFNPMATCTKISLEKGANDIYTINETNRPLGLNFGFHNQYMKTRKLNFLRNDTKSIFRVDRNLAHFTLSTFGIVDTDYDNYAVLWGCDPVLFGSVQNIDILSRTSTPSPEVIKTARDVVKELHVDYQPLDNVDQDHCVESSGIIGSSAEGDRNVNNMVIG